MIIIMGSSNCLFCVDLKLDVVSFIRLGVDHSAVIISQFKSDILSSSFNNELCYFCRMFVELSFLLGSLNGMWRYMLVVL